MGQDLREKDLGEEIYALFLSLYLIVFFLIFSSLLFTKNSFL